MSGQRRASTRDRFLSWETRFDKDRDLCVTATASMDPLTCSLEPPTQRARSCIPDSKTKITSVKSFRTQVSYFYVIYIDLYMLGKKLRSIVLLMLFIEFGLVLVFHLACM